MRAPRRLVIRSYRVADAAAVAALWNDVFPDPRPWNQPAVDIRRKMRVQRDLFLVGESGGALVATAIAGYDGHRGWIYRVAVAPLHRRRGIGRAIVVEALARLRRRGCPKVNLQIIASNHAVVAFYERLGFTVEERISMGKPLGSTP